MKRFTSKTEGTWVELIPNLTKRSLFSKEDIEDIKENNRETVEVSEEKSTELSNFYTSIKPELEEEDTYQLIAIDITEKSLGVLKGILNCRINGTHRQIRF